MRTLRLSCKKNATAAGYYSGGSKSADTWRSSSWEDRPENEPGMNSASSSTRTVAALAGTAKQKKSISPYSERRMRWDLGPRAAPSAAKVRPSKRTTPGSATPPAAGDTARSRQDQPKGWRMMLMRRPVPLNLLFFPISERPLLEGRQPFRCERRTARSCTRTWRGCPMEMCGKGTIQKSSSIIQAQAYCFNPDPAHSPGIDVLEGRCHAEFRSELTSHVSARCAAG